jgi:hypothetical protein
MSSAFEPGDVQFHCLSTKQKYSVKNPAMVETAHGRKFYVSETPYATHSKKNPEKKLGMMHRAVPKAHLLAMAPPAAEVEPAGAGAGPNV